MNLPKHWHIAELKGKEEIHHSSYTSKSRLLKAFVAILKGRDRFIIKIPNWKTFVIYKSNEPKRETLRDGKPNKRCKTCALYPLQCDGKKHECGQRDGDSDVIYKANQQGGSQ